MNDEYFKEHARRVRDIASFADPFTKQRLLALAERYDGGSRRTPLPSVTIQQHPDDEDGRADPG